MAAICLLSDAGFLTAKASTTRWFSFAVGSDSRKGCAWRLEGLEGSTVNVVCDVSGRFLCAGRFGLYMAKRACDAARWHLQRTGEGEGFSLRSHDGRYARPLVNGGITLDKSPRATAPNTGYRYTWWAVSPGTTFCWGGAKYGWWKWRLFWLVFLAVILFEIAALLIISIVKLSQGHTQQVVQSLGNIGWGLAMAVLFLCSHIPLKPVPAVEALPREDVLSLASLLPEYQPPSMQQQQQQQQVV